MGHSRRGGIIQLNKVSLFRKSVLIGLFLPMTIYRAILIFGKRGVNCSSNWLTPILPCQWFNVTFEIVLWVVVILLFLLELVRDHNYKDFFLVCKSFWPILVFVMLAALSLIWSILFQITLYKVFVLLTTTILAIYIGWLLRIQRFLDVLSWFFSAVCIVNLGWVSLFPKISIILPEYLHGAWNGIFWHKICLGAFMSLAIPVFLLKLLDWKKLTVFVKIINLVMLLTAIFILIKSKSATGIISIGISITLCLVVAAWLRWGKYLGPIHYYILLGIAVTAIVLIMSNLELIFGLLGRNTSLTGRIPVWTYLFRHVISQRPILGFGYGAIWNLEGFRIQMTLDLGLPLGVTQSDNGFIDIWLHLGIVGEVLLAGLIVLGFTRGVRYLLKVQTLASALPVVILVFALIANSTVSMFLETDTFVWAVVIASQVSIGTAHLQEPV